MLAKKLAEPGAVLNVNDPIMVVVENESDVAAFKDYKVEEGATAEPPPADSPAPAAPSAPAPAPSAAATSTAASPAPSGRGDRIIASPMARKLAAESGYDMSAISGSGPNGRILAADVEGFEPKQETAKDTSAAPSQAATTATASTAPPAGAVDFPVSPASAEIAARLAHSMQTAPHYYLTIELDVGPALSLLDQLNTSLGEEERISVTDLFIKASGSASKAVPAVNSSWLDSGVIRSYSRFDLNLVVGADASLVAPAILDVQRLGLKDIADATKKAIAAVDDESTPPEAYALGTFSLVNLGAFGVSSAAPIVATPQACALALGTIEEKLVPSEDPEKPYAVKSVLCATLSADHRVVDGAVGAQWLQALKGLIETPQNLLL